MKNKLFKTVSVCALLLSSSLLAQDYKFIAGGSLGYTSLNVEQTDKVGSMILGSTLENTGYNAELRVGVKYRDYLQLTVNYQSVAMDDTNENNVYLGIDYLFANYKKMTPYIGGNLGSSTLTWSKNPINTKDNDSTSGTLLLGARLGVLYPLTDDFDLSLEYMYNYAKHTTQLESGSAKTELVHSSANNLNLGVRYTF
ncbi:outer membrane protein [Candidatus Sulfurimonas baltica]|uniref:Outer membrane beta-barrel protein n=1 Tax=Candidatus Sulfurimonas baltica TaxID=2740404 RepID=A0A7S7LT17_9BACT|nr:outer membrane beta-barrel protein [Candidatus Sulfurimonas baltica]QOY51009.1 outer membrane beta-barrel protein [Candidatus Sulfurimonas baltica]